MLPSAFVIAATAAAASLAVAAPVNEGIHLLPRATPLQYEIVGNSGVSAQQMFLGTKDKVWHSKYALSGCFT